VKYSKLNSTLTLVANVGVLIGLMLIIVELRQNDQNLDATIQLSLSSAYQELASLPIENSDFAYSIMKSYGSPDELAPRETLSLMAWQYRYLLVLHTTFELRNSGIVSDEIWREKARHFTIYLRNPQLMKLYEVESKQEGLFPAEFYAAIDEIYVADWE